MTEIGPKTQTPALIGDADTRAANDPFAFLSVGGFENLLDSEMIAAMMGGVSLEASDVSFGEDMGAGDDEETPLAAAQALLALAGIHLRPGVTLTAADPKKAAQFLKKAEILAMRAMKMGVGENTTAQRSEQAVSEPVKALSSNFARADVPVDGGSAATGKVVAGILDKNVTPLATGKLPTPNKTGGTEIYTTANAKTNTGIDPAANAKLNTEIDPAAQENSGNDKGNNGRAGGYRVLATTIKSVDVATAQVGATANTGLSSGAAADTEMFTASGLLAVQMRAKGEVQAIETMRSSGVTASVSGEAPMSSENGFTGGRENGAGGTASTQTPLAGGRNTALHLDMLTKDWNEKLAQTLEQRISGGGKEIDFVLTPKSLGRLRVSMLMIEGQLSLAIKTDTAMAAAMLGDAESQLVQMLEARDLRVTSFAASTFGQPGRQNDSASQGHTFSNDEGRRENEDDIDAVEQVSALTADDDGINVTA